MQDYEEEYKGCYGGPETRCPENRVYRDESMMKQSESRLPLLDQEKCIAKLHDSINQLVHKLNRVLAPESETRADGENARTISGSPLGQQLDANNRAIDSATRKLHSIIERIEC